MEKLYKFKSDYSVERYFFRNFAPKSKNNIKFKLIIWLRNLPSTTV